MKHLDRSARILFSRRVVFAASKTWISSWKSRHPKRLILLALTLVASPAFADTRSFVSTNSIKQMSGLPQHDEVPIAVFGSVGAVSDLLVRCWSHPSSEWSRFRARFANSKCTYTQACEFLALLNAWQAGRATVVEHIRNGGLSTGFAIIAIFAREPDTRDQLLSLLPKDAAEQALAASAILNWLWTALQSERPFDNLARDHAQDFPYRGDSRRALAYTPFLRAGKALSFVWRSELERAIARQQRLLETAGPGVHGENCKAADALFRMAAIEPSNDIRSAFASLNLNICSSHPMSRTFAMSAMVECCIWDVGTVVMAGLHAPPFVDRDIVAGRLHVTKASRSNANLNLSETPPSNGGARPSPDPQAGKAPKVAPKSSRNRK